VLFRGSLVTENQVLVEASQKTQKVEAAVCPECGADKAYRNGWSVSIFGVPIQVTFVVFVLGGLVISML